MTTIEDQDANVHAAERDLADLRTQIEAAKQEHKRTAPAAAVRDNIPLAEACTRHAIAETTVGFLMDAEAATVDRVSEAHRAREAARAEIKYRERFKGAVAQRLAAIKVYEDARLAIETAETDYETANRAIKEAISYGLDRPFHLREHPLRLSWTIDHRTRVQLPAFASETVLWERYL